MPQRKRLDIFTGVGDPLAKTSPASDMGKAIKGKEFGPWPEALSITPPGYRNPEDIENALQYSEQDMQEHMKTKGHSPRAGFRLDENQVVTEFDPPKDDEGNFILDNPEEINIELTSQERKIGRAIDLISTNDLQPGDLDKLLHIWKAGQEGFRQGVDLASKKLNKVIQDLPDLGFSSTNFMTNFHLVREKIDSLIDGRLSDLQSMAKSLSEKDNEAFAGLQEEKYKQLEKELKDPNNITDPKEWLSKVSLFYGGDIKLIAEDPMGLAYPEDFRTMMNIYSEYIQAKEAAKAAADAKKRIEKPETVVTPQSKYNQFINRDFPAVSLDAAEGAKQRKILTNIQKHKGLMSETGIPDVIGQQNAILYSNEKEQKHLEQLKHAIDVLAPITKERNPSNEQISKVDRILAYIGTIGAEYYSAIPLVTQKGRLDQRMSLGDSSRFAIYMCLLYLAKAYKPWRTAINSTPPKVDVEKILESIKGGQLIAATVKLMIKLSQKLEAREQYATSDKALKIACHLMRR